MTTPSLGTAPPEGIVVNALAKRYSTRDTGGWALHDLSLSIQRGSFTVILGRSGSGKSTLLRLLAGLSVPSAGHVTCDGAPVQKGRKDIRYVFQDYAESLFPWKTVWRNVHFGAKHGGAARHERAGLVQEALQRVSLGDAAAKYPWQLSGGMQQRVAIARALASRPRVLLLDEPFGAVDALSRASLQDTILDVWTALGLTVVLVTHDIDEAIYLGDRVLVLHSRGEGLVADLNIGLARPRDRVSSLEDPAFGGYRRRLLTAVTET
jgi:ABC-type nitrate/sulfonate/bicarbonate transport system ATPase subunit